MFDLINLVKFVSLLTYLGFIIGSVSGIYENSKVFNLCEMLVSIVVICLNLTIIYFQLTNELYRYLKNNKNIFFTSSIFMLICSLLIIGLSDIGLGFGIWGIIMAIINCVSAIFITDEPII
jgi:hypothetical protein